VRVIALTLTAFAFSGCAGYQLGSQSLYPPDIHTVYVPIAESDSFRRYLGEQLTEAICKEIEEKTPYKVVGNPSADSVLNVRIVSDSKHVIVEDPNDQPRQVEFNMMVQVNWTNRKGDLICEAGTVPIPAEVVQLSQSGLLVPEYGQSVATARTDAVEKLAQQIVALMESPW
jgi:lipopolysaccharide assembly LptE-like protein